MPKIPPTNPAFDPSRIFTRSASQVPSRCTFPGCEKPLAKSGKSQSLYCDLEEHNENSAAELRGEQLIMSLRADAATGDREAAYTLGILTWKPETRMSTPALSSRTKKAVEERASHAREFSEHCDGDGFPREHSKHLWRIDGAHHVARELHEIADNLIRKYVMDAREAGETWTNIARHLNITKSAAINRYGPSSSDGDLTTATATA